MGSPALASYLLILPLKVPQGQGRCLRELYPGSEFWFPNPDLWLQSMGHCSSCLLMHETTRFFSILKFLWGCSSWIQFLPLCLNPSHTLSLLLVAIQGHLGTYQKANQDKRQQKEESICFAQLTTLPSLTWGFLPLGFLASQWCKSYCVTILSCCHATTYGNAMCVCTRAHAHTHPYIVKTSLVIMA